MPDNDPTPPAPVISLRKVDGAWEAHLTESTLAEDRTVQTFVETTRQIDSLEIQHTRRSLSPVVWAGQREMPVGTRVFRSGVLVAVVTHDWEASRGR